MSYKQFYIQCGIIFVGRTHDNKTYCLSTTKENIEIPTINIIEDNVEEQLEALIGSLVYLDINWINPISIGHIIDEKTIKLVYAAHIPVDTPVSKGHFWIEPTADDTKLNQLLFEAIRNG